MKCVICEQEFTPDPKRRKMLRPQVACSAACGKVLRNRKSLAFMNRATSYRRPRATVYQSHRS